MAAAAAAAGAAGFGKGRPAEALLQQKQCVAAAAAVAMAAHKSALADWATEPLASQRGFRSPCVRLPPSGVTSLLRLKSATCKNATLIPAARRIQKLLSSMLMKAGQPAQAHGPSGHLDTPGLVNQQVW